MATPIEQQMNGVDHMLYIQSTNANDGTMNQSVTFDVGTNIDIDNVLVQNRFSQAQPFLPQDVKNFGVTIKKSLAFPLIVVSLYSPDGRYDASFLANYAHHQHQRRAPARQGRRRHPQPRRVRLRDAHLAQARRAGAPGPHGHRRPERACARRTWSTRPARSAPSRRRPASSSRTPCARRAAWSTPEEFGDVIVRENPDGSLVRVQDVARIELGSLNYEQYGAFNGKPAGVIAAFQMPGSNALDVASAIRATMDELEEALSARAWTTRSRSTPPRR